MEDSTTKKKQPSRRQIEILRANAQGDVQAHTLPCGHMVTVQGAAGHCPLCRAARRKAAKAPKKEEGR